MNQTTLNGLTGKKILIATVAADGHFNPLTGLAKFLADSGADVRWYTSVVHEAKLKQLGIPHFPFLKAIDINANNIHNLFPQRKFLTDAGQKANFDMINIFIKPGPDHFEDIRDLQQEFPFDAIVTESMFPAIPYLSAMLDVPVISVGIIPLAESSDDLGPYGPGFYPPSNTGEQENIVRLNKTFSEEVYKEHIDCLSLLLSRYDIQHQRTNVFDMLIKTSDLYLQIGSPSFEYTRSNMGQNVRFIGSLLPYSARTSENRWDDQRLDEYQKVVLVTQGTIENDITKLLEPTLEAFKGTDTLVIATTGGNQTQELRTKYPYNNLIIEDYIPFDEVMPFAHVYITNGGYGGTLLGIKNRLPMVAAGLFEGKAEICARVGYFKYGIDLKTERPTPDEIRNAVVNVIADPVYKNNITALADEMEQYDARELCAKYLVELLNQYNTINVA
ncbi:glycosyltransferase [Mucilaginibacter endophyticus]|uniref:glycosyltransferase n=1 Tax=Mucilaginibacter endophyticus TaxID=2675003 RepID=UPI000E0D9C0D|nr:glycosyltransferase [Mucilaginibacter endophyticus]